MSGKQIFWWELLGCLVITTGGFLLHFCYEWSGKWFWAGLFCAVNESVWEHMKIGFWPYFTYAFIETLFLKNPPENFWFAKMVGLYVLSLTIPVLFYFYTALIGKHLLVIDIIIFIIAILLAQGVSFYLLKIGWGSQNHAFSTFLLILILLAYSLFTYFPPHIELFRDPLNNGYGISKFQQ